MIKTKLQNETQENKMKYTKRKKEKDEQKNTERIRYAIERKKKLK